MREELSGMVRWPPGAHKFTVTASGRSLYVSGSAMHMWGNPEACQIYMQQAEGGKGVGRVVVLRLIPCSSDAPDAHLITRKPAKDRRRLKEGGYISCTSLLRQMGIHEPGVRRRSDCYFEGTHLIAEFGRKEPTEGPRGRNAPKPKRKPSRDHPWRQAAEIGHAKREAARREQGDPEASTHDTAINEPQGDDNG